MSITPQDLRDELEASRASRKRAILQEIRWVLKDTAGIELPPAAKKTIDLEGRLIKDVVIEHVAAKLLGVPENPGTRYAKL
jgi:hypothetical protein